MVGVSVARHFAKCFDQMDCDWSMELGSDDPRGNASADCVKLPNGGVTLQIAFAASCTRFFPSPQIPLTPTTNARQTAAPKKEILRSNVFSCRLVADGRACAQLRLYSCSLGSRDVLH